MASRSKKPKRGLTSFALAWLVLTLSLVTWWWIHGMSQPGVEERVHRMLYWEGLFLIPVLFIGGAVLVYLTYHHQQRHEQLGIFFSTFAHDLKTSMTRLRLQGELLEEQGGTLDPKVGSILKDIQRLDLQLENSLWMAQIDSGQLLTEKTTLREVMEHLRNDFSEIRLEIGRDAEIIADRRAFAVVLRNLFQNSVLHGKADRIDINVKADGDNVILEIGDNGQGLTVQAANLGHDILASGGKNSNGLGLYLSRRLTERMHGRLDFTNQNRFLNVLTMKGRVL